MEWILHWVEYCTGLQVEEVQIEDVIDLYITVQWHRSINLDSEAKEVLAQFQADILVHRQHQTNLIVDYYKRVGFEDESDEESEKDLRQEDEYTMDKLDTDLASSGLAEDNGGGNHLSEY